MGHGLHWQIKDMWDMNEISPYNNTETGICIPSFVIEFPFSR
jgi:hypothetical protein